MFTQGQLKVIKYCAEECERQSSGEVSVYDMLNGWQFASIERDLGTNLDCDFIEALGRTVEPVDNKNGFRQIRIFVGDGRNNIEKAPWENVPRLLNLLLESYYEGILMEAPMHPLANNAEDQFYFEYENIHPFRDGNGRSGKIIYNYLCGTLNNPMMPTNFWGSSNP